MMRAIRTHQPESDQRAFTLIELLVSMAIIAIIAAVTVIGVRTVAEDAKISSAKNTIAAVLDNARGLAMKENTVVMVVFRAKFINDRTQVVEAVTAKYSGASYVNGGLLGSGLVDRFLPIETVAARELPKGIAVAGPHYDTNRNDLWVASSNLIFNRTGEMAGAILAVMFGPDGTMIRDNPRTDAVQSWVDFNARSDFSQYGAVRQRRNGSDFWPEDTILNDAAFVTCDMGIDVHPTQGGNITQYFCHFNEDDEPYVIPVPFLAVFNEDEVRELYDTSGWNVGVDKLEDLSDYLNTNADPIYFNRYTGVVMK